MDQLWQLASLVDDAVDCLRRAEAMACGFLADEQTGQELSWKAMEAVAERASAATRIIEAMGIVAPIADAIKEESDRNDDMADKADAASY